MVVSAEVTDSVFGDDEVLYAYRAWLLWCYWKQDGDSSSTDDATIWQMQCGHIETLYGKSDQTRRWSKLLWQEKLAYIADQIAA